MRTLSPLTRGALGAAALALSSTCAVAQTDLASPVYGNGEAMPPTAEARMIATTTTPGGGLTRDEVRQQLAEAIRDGTLGAAGEIADRPEVLVARATANERQTQEILAAHEAYRQRVAALEAEAEVGRQAVLRSRALIVEAPAAAAGTGETTAMAPVEVAPPAGTPVPSVNDMEAAPGPVAAPSPQPVDAPTDKPARRPFEQPAVAPLEIPITRPTDLSTEMLIDKD